MTCVDEFAEYVRDALTHFYDPVHLQTHPLADLLLAESAEEEKAPELRELLLEAVEKLRPPSTISFSRPEWLGYRILRERYIETREITDLCADIGLSRSALYSYQKKALQALSDILWEVYQRQQPEAASPDGATPVEADGSSAAKSSAEEEEAERVARRAPVKAVNLFELLNGVSQTFRPLAQQDGVSLFIVAEGTPAFVYGDPAMLRQMILNVLVEVLPLVEESPITCSVSRTQEDTVLHLQVPRTKPEAGGAFPEEGRFKIGRGLSQVYGGRFRVERERSGALDIALTLPTAWPRTLLIVDDDTETVRLYAQYLLGHDYVLRQVGTAEDVRRYLSGNRPDLIILDVLMPGEDGWDILQMLKSDAQWAPIPVLICSVLKQPRLALALGAGAVLQKPVDPQALIRTIGTLLPG